MSPLCFVALSKPLQIEYLVVYGEAVNELETEHSFDSLFLIHGFFVEVSLDKESNEITRITLADSPDVQYKYVHALEIDFLQHNA